MLLSLRDSSQGTDAKSEEATAVTSQPMSNFMSRASDKIRKATEPFFGGPIRPAVRRWDSRERSPSAADRHRSTSPIARRSKKSRHFRSSSWQGDRVQQPRTRDLARRASFGSPPPDSEE